MAWKGQTKGIIRLTEIQYQNRTVIALKNERK